MRHSLIILLLFISGYCFAQQTKDDYRRNLSKRVSLSVQQTPLREVLQLLSKAGEFYFSYNGQLFNQDSLISLKVRNVPVRDVLDQVFAGKVDYKENAEYIILRYAVNHLTIEAERISTDDNHYEISGYVKDTRSGDRVKQASVYEKRLLQAALTDQKGYFTLRFRGEHTGVVLTASKESYRDTSLVFLADINVKPEKYTDPDSEKGTFFSNTFGGKGIWRFLTSSKQRIQNLNIPDFLAQTPFQVSFTPGLSSHGSMSSSIVNKASLNVLGGYTAGTDGFEMAGAFNLTKGDIKKFQIAGLFNAVGGSVKGIQLAGAYNDVKNEVGGFQIAGLLNDTKGKVNGAQVAGVANIARKSFKGVQIAGLLNSSRETSGLQLAGVTNSTFGVLNGAQVGGILNYAKKMKGFQFGLVNLADSSSGVSLGLVNLSSNGFRQISIYSNEVTNTNIALKTGNSKLYSLLIAGNNFSDTARVLTFGFGLGHEFLLNKRLSITTEVTGQSIYLGNWSYFNNLYRFQTQFQVMPAERLIVFAGPSYTYYRTDAPPGASGKNYKHELAPSWAKHFNNQAKGWLGWNFGLSVLL